MELDIEQTNAREKILIIDKNGKHTLFIQILKKELKKYRSDIFVSPALPARGTFDICFVLNQPNLIRHIEHHRIKKTTFVLFNAYKQASFLAAAIAGTSQNHIKVIHIDDNEDALQNKIDQILWFSFSKSPELFLNLQNPIGRIKKQPLRVALFWNNLFKTKNAIILFFSLFFLYHALFIIPLAAATYFSYKGAAYLKNNRNKDLEQSVRLGNISLKMAKTLYGFSRPTFLFFSLASIPDNIVQINEQVQNLFVQTGEIKKNGEKIILYIFKKDASFAEKKDLIARIQNVKNAIEKFDESAGILYQKLPDSPAQFSTIKHQIKQALEASAKLQKFIPFAQTLLAKNTEAKYLILFANNMELRPGGGFIGSFGILSVKDFSFENLQIYDVYDADGQLTAHIEPPPAIKTYLNQPHWFLRDSAFSGDFAENYKNALFFLEKEMGIAGFSGGIIMTTSTIQNMLSSFENLYISDFREIINKDNFYLKAQYYAEKQFFPGSTQKKSFLSAVARSLLLNLNRTSPQSILYAIQKSLEEKQMALYFEDPSLGELVRSLYWSGQTILPGCIAQNSNCIVDYLFPLEANVGVNKANFLINKLIDLKIRIDESGFISNTINIVFKNSSLHDVFPGGIYKNYFQVMLPKDITIKHITKNGTLVENVDETVSSYRTIGFYFEVQPQEKTEITIEYIHNNPLQKGNGMYQLVIQKQLGSSNSDFNLQLHLPKNIYILNQNFSPLVKSNKILYNTSLLTDKIFVTELIKE